MKTRTLIIAVMLALTAACANKTTALQTASISHDSLAVAQDIEARLCWNVSSALQAPSDKTHCTAPVAATIGLTDERHKAINAKLHQAFELHRSASQLAASGGQVDYSALNAIIREVLALVGQLQQTPDVKQLATAVRAGGQ